MNLGIELLVGTLLAVLCVALVLDPLFRPVEAADAPSTEPSTSDEWEADLAAEDTPRARALAALREIEFDRETGKLDDHDYQSLKARYTRAAIEAMRSETPAPTPAGDLVAVGVATLAVGAPDPLDALAEARIASARALAAAPRVECPTCGPRPEADATFCSTCGRPLAP